MTFTCPPSDMSGPQTSPEDLDALFDEAIDETETDDTEFEVKAVRRIRTLAGAAHYGQPIGSIINTDRLPSVSRNTPAATSAPAVSKQDPPTGDGWSPIGEGLYRSTAPIAGYDNLVMKISYDNESEFNSDSSAEWWGSIKGTTTNGRYVSIDTELGAGSRGDAILLIEHEAKGEASKVALETRHFTVGGHKVLVEVFAGEYQGDNRIASASIDGVGVFVAYQDSSGAWIGSTWIGVKLNDEQRWAGLAALEHMLDAEAPPQFTLDMVFGVGHERPDLDVVDSDNVNVSSVEEFEDAFAPNTLNTEDLAAAAAAAAKKDPNANTGDTAVAKTMVKGIAERIAEGVDPEKAHKDYKKELHRTRLRVQRARRKQEKIDAASKEADAEDVEDDKKLTPKTSVPADSKLDPVIAADMASDGDQPLALYEQDLSGASGPGASSTMRPWWDRLTKDTAEGETIPVVGLHDSGTEINGYAVRRDGITYVVNVGNGPSAPDFAKIDAAAAVYTQMLKNVPPEHRAYQRGVLLHTTKNPADEYWAKQYDMQGFSSRATASMGRTIWWNGNAPNVSTASHEFGHNVDSQASTISKSITRGGANKNQTKSWSTVDGEDAPIKSFMLQNGFVETRVGDDKIIEPSTAGSSAPTAYAAKSPQEDFAESTRLYLKDKHEGSIGYLKSDSFKNGNSYTKVTFADMFPARSRVLDEIFGNETPTASAFKTKQADRVKKNYESYGHSFGAGGPTGLAANDPAYIAAVQQGTAAFNVAQAKHASEALTHAAALHLGTVSDTDLITLKGSTTPYNIMLGTNAVSLSGLDDKTSNELVMSAVQKERDYRYTKAKTAMNDYYTNLLKAMDVDALEGATDIEHLPSFDSDPGVLPNLAYQQPAANWFKTIELSDMWKEAHVNYLDAIKGTLDDKAGSVDLDNANNGSELAALLVKAKLGEASVTDLEGVAKHRISKRKAAVKFKKKKELTEEGWSTAEIEMQSQAAAEAYETEAIIAYAQGLGLLTPTGQYTDLDADTSAVSIGFTATSDEMIAPSTLPLTPTGNKKWPKNSKNGKAFLRGRDKPHPLAKTKIGYGEAQSSYSSDKQAKSDISAELASRMNNPEDWEVFRVMYDLGAFDDHTPESRQVLLDTEVSTMIGRWASTSGDSEPKALIMQAAIAEEFDLKSDPLHRLKVTKSPMYTMTLKEVNANIDKYKPLFRRFARHMYEHTQEELAAANITHVRLARGMNTSYVADSSLPWLNESSARVPMQPANSWTTTRSTSQSFGNKQFAALVPASRILGSARTGFGCRSENEFVVLDTEGEVNITDAYTSDLADLLS